MEVIVSVQGGFEATAGATTVIVVEGQVFGTGPKGRPLVLVIVSVHGGGPEAGLEGASSTTIVLKNSQIFEISWPNGRPLVEVNVCVHGGSWASVGV